MGIAYSLSLGALKSKTIKNYDSATISFLFLRVMSKLSWCKQYKIQYLLKNKMNDMKCMLKWMNDIDMMNCNKIKYVEIDRLCVHTEGLKHRSCELRKSKKQVTNPGSGSLAGCGGGEIGLPP